MPEEVTEETEATEATEETTEEAVETVEDKELGPAGEKALEAFKKRARDAEAEKKALEAKVKEFEDRDKSEQEKLAEQAEQARAEAEKAKLDNARMKAGLEAGLDPELFDRIVGDDFDAMVEDAKGLAAKMKPKQTQDFDGGARKTTKSPDRAALVELMKNDPEEFNRRVDAGEIPADALA
jgi:hypothetical protein